MNSFVVSLCMLYSTSIISLYTFCQDKRANRLWLIMRVFWFPRNISLAAFDYIFCFWISCLSSVFIIYALKQAFVGPTIPHFLGINVYTIRWALSKACPPSLTKESINASFGHLNKSIEISNAVHSRISRSFFNLGWTVDRMPSSLPRKTFSSYSSLKVLRLFLRILLLRFPQRLSLFLLLYSVLAIDFLAVGVLCLTNWLNYFGFCANWYDLAYLNMFLVDRSTFTHCRLWNVGFLNLLSSSQLLFPKTLWLLPSNFQLWNQNLVGKFAWRNRWQQLVNLIWAVMQ